MVERLCGLMTKAIEKNLFINYSVGEKGIQVNLLQHVDDTIFVGDASLRNVFTIKSILRCFELVSGLKVNFHKSRFFTIRVERDVKERYTNLLNCKLLRIPFV